MKFKLDENLGSRTAGLIAQSGHDVETIAQEKLPALRRFPGSRLRLVWAVLRYYDAVRLLPHVRARIAN